MVWKLILVFLCALTCSITQARETCAPPATSERIQFLEQRAKQLVQGCQIRASDGTTLFTPDGKANYNALWTRDFAYMVENAGDLIPAPQIEACLRYLLQGQREDGAIPDRVQADGLAVYVAGPVQHPLGEANLDNPPFLVTAVDEFLKRLPPKRAQELFREWSRKLDYGLDWVPRSAQGLVFNNPQKPHSPYGFTDTVGKTGNLLMESLLYWTACNRMAVWHKTCGSTHKANDYRNRARQIEKNISLLWDESRGAFFAAEIDCRQIDIWGNAYAVCLNFPLGQKRARIIGFLASNYDAYVWNGQVRHLLRGEYWERQLTPVQRERYQNGAYWATASGWVISALAPRHPALAEKTVTDLLTHFRQHGIFECINEGYTQLDTYVVSATNPLRALKTFQKRSALFAPKVK